MLKRIYVYYSKVERVDIVRLKLKGSRKTDIYIDAICIPLICSPLQNQTIDIAECREKYEHLSNLEFADKKAEGESLKIDVIICVMADPQPRRYKKRGDKNSLHN